MAQKQQMIFWYGSDPNPDL